MGTPAENVRHGHARAAGRTLTEPPRGHLVRIIEYTVTIRPQVGLPRSETFRLVTSLLDHRLAPAHQLATAYHQRWEIENGFAVLRSKAPELICQEIYALLTVYQALCALQTRAAEHGGTDPDRISFAVTVQLARPAVAQAAADVTTLGTARREVTTELLAALLSFRRNRQCPRTKKPSKNTFEVRKRDRPRTPSNIRYTLKVTKHST